MGALVYPNTTASGCLDDISQCGPGGYPGTYRGYQPQEPWVDFATTGGWLNRQIQKGLDWVLGDADTAYARARGVEENASPHLQDRRQVEYDRAKELCDAKGQMLDDPCAELNRRIEHAKMCIELYKAWDARWSPGRHDEKLDTWRNRLGNLKDEHNKECTEPWHQR